MTQAPDHVRALITQFWAIHASAQAERNQTVDGWLRKYDHRDWISSVVDKSRRKQAALAEMYRQAWDAAITKRMGQLRFLNRKLTRCCPDWPVYTDGQLRDELLSPHNKERSNGDIS